MNIENSRRRRKDPGEFAGLTISQVIEHPRGKLGRGLSLLIIFSDKSWAGISVDVDGVGADCCGFLDFQAGYSDAIFDYLDPVQLLEARLIDPRQMAVLLELQKQADVSDKEQQLITLRAQVANLEADIQKLIIQ
jgi:hypothetical protein